ncbi:unnamed protein product [Brassica napus]|uniref:(rape) hypothetical protein n=1 Tax=Brassica napus TaxID=3708 RepID=A0A816T815_BRANA|nr:unnamed protein product [Brassica napus]
MLLLRNAFDALRLGRSSQFVIARLLRFWDSESMKNMFDQTPFRFSLGKQMKVKSQEQKLAVPEPALIKDLDSRCVNTKLIKLNWNQRKTQRNLSLDSAGGGSQQDDTIVERCNPLRGEI